ncbi:uncharacterized protein BDW47DRAFT_105410 [Aspergillus candidus]|uniref:Uncharacterized protein n=1 Tax=Aspergillus candidus TaxID=41067 RepID=A0A2I2FC24_ASPCN|nr:hypothetical protein BDW47DRAFT_105410 [Aspergillus candidus]PLB38157.1 hypothetical protein BDW47DRAFT_105410 [Aspergillus candidus]
MIPTTQAWVVQLSVWYVRHLSTTLAVYSSPSSLVLSIVSRSMSSYSLSAGRRQTRRDASGEESSLSCLFCVYPICQY